MIIYEYELKYNNKTKCYKLCKIPKNFNCKCPKGPTGDIGPQGIPGEDGNGILSTIDNGDGTFTFNYKDGTSFTTSDLTGPQGPQGPQGETGLNIYTDYSISPIITNDYNIDINNDYDIYQIDTTSNIINFILPEITTLTNNKRIYNIVDVGGNLNNNNCNINISGSDTIQGSNSYIMNINYSNTKLCSNTINKWLIL